tara:strand:+ start:436 stop:936 length:501 start_codon:yes stop_codon:yes gene_type:complete
MEYDVAKAKFVQSWGVLGSNWGINKTMAQIHALLLISVDPLSTEDVMEELKISRGNANMNIRALIDWGLVYKEIIPGERKEFFNCEKDIWQISIRILRERRRREFEPIIHVLDQLKEVEGDSKEVKEFNVRIEELAEFTGKVDSILEKLSKSDQNIMLSFMMKLIR